MADRRRNKGGTVADDSDWWEDDDAVPTAEEFESPAPISTPRSPSRTATVELGQRQPSHRRREGRPLATAEGYRRAAERQPTRSPVPTTASYRRGGSSSPARFSRYSYREVGQQHSGRYDPVTGDGFRRAAERQQTRSPVPMTEGHKTARVNGSTVGERLLSKSPSPQFNREGDHRGREVSCKNSHRVHRQGATVERDLSTVDRRGSERRCTSPSRLVPPASDYRAASPGRIRSPSGYLDVTDGGNNQRRRSSSWDATAEARSCHRRGPARPIDGSIVIPKFDGSGDLELFLKRFQAIAEYCHWNDRETLFRLEQSILDDAQYVMMDTPPARTVAEYMATLRSRFGFVANAEQYRAELSHLRRGTMTIHALNLEVRRLVNKAFPGSWSRSTEVYARDAFLRALDNPELRTRILMSMPPPETLSAAYQLAVRAVAVASEPIDDERSRQRRASSS